MYPFSISADEHAPLNFPIKKRLSKLTKIHLLFNTTFIYMNIFSPFVASLKCTPTAGPALASAGPNWKQFCGAPLSGVCRNFFWGHQGIMIIP